MRYFSPSTLIRYDILDRPYYALGLLIAFDQAKKLGHEHITIIELGVGEGGGLLNLCKTSASLSREFGIACDVIGFDTGTGVPVPQGYKDHPEVWMPGQFTHDKKQLHNNLPTNARILYGDVRQAIPQFCATWPQHKPIAFVSVDLDYYSSTKKALDIFLGRAANYLPAVLMYVDDIEHLLTYNSYCGEMLALKEFNRENKYRKIERKQVRVDSQPRYWHRHIYCCHILDHPIRNGPINVLGGRNEIKMSDY